jgi:mycothiol synthase
VDVVALTDMDGARRDALVALVGRAEALDGHPPLPEPQRAALTRDGEAAHGVRAVVAEREGVLVGCALVTPGRDGSAVIHLVTDPGEPERAALASELLAEAVRASTHAGHAAPLHLWAMRAGPAEDELAQRHGFAPERDVVQMRVPLPLAAAVVDATRPITTRPFVAGRDEEAWLAVNNRAFAGHPEQGSWTLAQLHERLAADWVDLDGFLVADDPDGNGLIGSCWTKIHRDRHGAPVFGEIYVIAVDPSHHGGGLGRALTVAGLTFMAGRGVRVGMLYTDASNEAAVALYRALGFTVDHVDRSYRRDVPGATVN